MSKTDADNDIYEVVIDTTNTSVCSICGYVPLSNEPLYLNLDNEVMCCITCCVRMDPDYFESQLVLPYLQIPDTELFQFDSCEEDVTLLDASTEPINYDSWFNFLP